MKDNFFDNLEDYKENKKIKDMANIIKKLCHIFF